MKFQAFSENFRYYDRKLWINIELSLLKINIEQLTAFQWSKAMKCIKGHHPWNRTMWKLFKLSHEQLVPRANGQKWITEFLSEQHFRWHLITSTSSSGSSGWCSRGGSTYWTYHFPTSSLWKLQTIFTGALGWNPINYSHLPSVTVKNTWIHFILGTGTMVGHAWPSSTANTAALLPQNGVYWIIYSTSLMNK